jgi:quinol-cytochrome oxidoreductase complex cytochrome b subunit
MEPSFGGVSPIILLIVVLFPAPFLPRRPTTSPFDTVMETSKRIWLNP